MIDLQELLEKIKPYVLGWAHPNWQNWTPTPAGYSANPTNTVYRYLLIGKICFITMREVTAGTSNSATATYTLPFTAATITNQTWLFPAAYVNNGTPATTYGRGRIASGGTTIIFGIDASQDGGFTASGDKRIAACDAWYEIA